MAKLTRHPGSHPGAAPAKELVHWEHHIPPAPTALFQTCWTQQVGKSPTNSQWLLDTPSPTTAPQDSNHARLMSAATIPLDRWFLEKSLDGKSLTQGTTLLPPPGFALRGLVPYTRRHHLWAHKTSRARFYRSYHKGKALLKHRLRIIALPVPFLKNKSSSSTP